MRRTALSLAACLAMVLLPGEAPARTAAFNPGAERVIVAFERLPGDLRERLAHAGVTHAAVFPSVSAAAVVGPPESYRAIARWDGVTGIWADSPMRLFMWQANATTRVDQVRVGVPPLETSYTGQGVTVAIADTGIDTTHPDLAGKVVANLDFTPSAIFRPTDVNEPLIPEPVSMPAGVDVDAHGTFLAGVAAGTGAAARGPEDMRGVAPGAKLVNLRLGSGIVTPSSSMAAFEWILEHRDDPEFPGGIRVAVAGIGGTCEPAEVCEMPVFRQLLQRIIDAGVVVVFPAGAARGNEITYPARYPEIIAVKGGCKDQDDWSAAAPLAWAGVEAEPLGGPQHPGSWCGEDQTWGGHGGPAVDVVAPAIDVWHANPVGWNALGFYPLWRPPAPGGGDPFNEASNSIWYHWAWSHSLAAAHVAGIAALMLEANPCLTQADVQSILWASARDLGPQGFDAPSGFGMADALGAVAAAEDAAGCAS